MVWPAPVKLVGLAVLVRVSAGVWTAGTVAVDWLEVTGLPAESVPEAVAELVTEPASTLAWVVVEVAVQVVEAPAARVAIGSGLPEQVTALNPARVSAMPMLVIVVVPLLWTTRVQVMVWPGALKLVGLAVLVMVSALNGMVAVAVLVVTGLPAESVPLAETELVTCPAVTSAAVVA